MDLYLENKTAIVTGASQGIGAAIAKELAANGVKVFATARNEKLLAGLHSDICDIGKAEAVTFFQDINAIDGPRNIAREALHRLGHVDILINNAGRSQPVDAVGDEKLWAESMNLDFNRPRELTQYLLPHFIERGQGAILNLASTYELRSINVSAVAKAAMVMWSKQLAGELGQHGIRINCLQPGLIDTQNIRRFFPGDQRKQYAEKEIPLGDFGEPSDVANMATFLVSPRAKYITGTVAIVDGGGRRHAF